MADRYRSRTIRNDSATYLQQAYLGTANGTCLVEPSYPTAPWALYTKSGSFIKDYEAESIQDVVTPGFHKLRAKGVIVNNPLTQTKVVELASASRVEMNYVSCRYACTPSRWYRYQRARMIGERSVESIAQNASLPLYLTPPVVSPELMKDLCTTKAFARIGNDQMLALAALAEANSTVDGLAQILKKVLRIKRYVQRRDIKHLRGEISFNELREAYLNARYNLRPLYYDAKAILKVLQKDLKESPPRQTFRTSMKEDQTSSMSNVVAVQSFGLTALYALVKHTATTEVDVRAGVLTAADQLTYSSLLGFDKLVDTAWDLIPFSFILDWFFNVGETIASWVPVMGFETLTSWVTVITTKTQTTTVGFDHSYFGQNASYKYEPDGYTGMLEALSTKITTVKERIPNPSRPILPHFALKLDALKILDLAAIAHAFKTTGKTMHSRL